MGTTSPGAMHEQFSPQELQQTQHRFIQGDIYSPTDLSWEALRARRSQRKLMKDTFDMLGINPLTQYKNFNLLADFVTSMGRIKHSNETGLRAVNQRKVAKAVRRAVGIGLMPSTHRHPEILKKEEESHGTVPKRRSQ